MRRTLLTLLTASLAFTLPLAAHAEELILLHTNDIHDHLEPYTSREGKEVGGLDRLAALVAEHRAKHPNVLVLDAGDVFQGTPLYTFFKGEVDYKAMSHVGYDVGVVGNHEFDDGWVNLEKQLAHAGYPILCANLVKPDGAPAFLPAMTFRRGETRIGVIGLIGDEAWNVVAPKMRAGLKQLPCFETARQWVAALRPQVDLIVVLTHHGFVEDQELAKAVPGIDVIVGGHSHTVVPQPKLVPNGNQNGIGGTLVVQAGFYTQYLGRLKLDVDKGRITSYSGELLPVGTHIQPPKYAVKGLVAPYAAKVHAQMSVVLGRSPEGLSAAGKYAGETPLGNWLADMIKEVGGAEVGIMNSGGIRADLPAGQVTVGQVYQILPFENKVVTFDTPGHELAKIVQATATKLHQRKSGTMQFAGLSFVTKDGRIEGPILVNGKPLDPAKRYRVATIDYLLGGTEGQYFLERSGETMGDLLRDVMIARVRRLQTVTAPSGGRIVVR